MNEIKHLFELGGPTMYAIAILAVAGATIFVERMLVVVSLVGQLQALDRRIRDAARTGHLPEMVSICANAPAGVSAVLMRGIEATIRRASRDEILAEMSRDGRRFSLKLRRGLGLLATLGSMSPFLGLFGTVLGIMQALEDIGASGATGMDVVAGGVSEALVDTAAGIIVAVVMVLLHQILRAQVSRAVLEVQVLVEDAADQFSRLPPPPPGETAGSLAARGDKPVQVPVITGEGAHVPA